MGRTKITNADFTHLHNHTEYSSFDGLNKISKFPKYAAEQGFKALAMTDHGNMGGAFKFMKECASFGIKPITGCEFYLSRDRHVNYERKYDKETKTEITGQIEKQKGNRHVVLIAKNWTGYQNLCRLSQTSWTDGFYHSPRIDFELLAEHSEGLICTSACLSSVVNSNLLYDRYDKAKKAVSLFKDIFKDDFYLEVMYHGIDAEAAIIPDILKLSEEMNVTCYCTNDCHYCEQCQGRSQELLMAMSSGSCLTNPKRMKFPYDEFYLKSAAEMSKIFGTKPELLLNTNKVVDKIDHKDIFRSITGKMRLPRYDIPKEYPSPYEYLKKLAWDGMRKYGWDTSQKHVDRLNMELYDVKIVWENNRYDFATYFLIVRDYMRAAKDKGIMTGCGRGSGFGSVLLRCLDITYGPDPLAYGLLWERFLGFDDKFFMNERDFGLDAEVGLNEVGHVIHVDTPDVLVEDADARDVENDLGGVDRY